MSLYFDRSGKPLSDAAFFNLLEREDAGDDYRRVARDQAGPAVVSTVWLGVNHGTDEAPLIFETLVFGGRLHGTMERYGTEEEAKAGHMAVVERVRAAEGEVAHG